MLKRIRHNVILKILSVLFAGVLWLIVYNINNPLESRNVEVDIVFLNEASLAANNLKVTNDYRRQVTAQISGRKSQLDQTLQRDFRAMADFSTVTNEGTEFIRVESIQYLGEQNIRYVIREDDRINLVVEKIVTGDYPIRIEATGQPEEQYQLVGITVRPENYSVKETDSLIGRIDHAVVRVDLEGIKGNSTRRIYTEIYGKDGRIINELSNYFIVDVTIEVAKEVPVIPSTIGSLPADHVVVSLMAIPEKILVSGPASELGPLESIRTENIDLGGRTEPFSTTVRLTTIPQNSRVVGRSDIMEVSVYVEKLAERTFTFTRNEIEVRYADTTGTYSYVITEPTVSFVLKGRRLHVNEIEKSQLNPHIDVAGMKDETRLIPVRISVPENTLQVNYPSLEVVAYRNMTLNIERGSITLNNMRTGLYDYTIITQTMQLKLRGFTEDINEINPILLNPRVNVGQLGPGTHTMEVEVNLPDGVVKTGQNTIQILVADR